MSSIESTLKRISTLTAVTLLITLFVSNPFWLNNRIYPLVPVYPGLHVADWLGNLIFVGLLLSLMLLSFFPKQLYRTISLVLIAALIVLDQSRIQPYIYMYFMTLLFLSLPPAYRNVQMDCLRLMCAFAYIWAGLQKMNIEFYERIMPWFIYAIVPRETVLNNQFIHQCVSLLVLSTPVFEAAIGFLYLTEKKKKIPLLMSGVMLTFVLLALGPLGHQFNIIVWPWNVWLFIMSYNLFKDNPTAASIFSLKTHPVYGMKILCILMFGIVPGLVLLGKWDAYQSFQLYSGNINTATANIDKTELDKLPKSIRYYADDNNRLDFNRLSYGLYNMATYPEKRIFLSVWETWCHDYGLSNSTLTITKMSKDQVYDCRGLLHNL